MLSLFLKKRDLKPADVQKARAYISDYWAKLTVYHPKDEDALLGLPGKYIVPATEEGHEFDFREMYYWDSYFHIQALLDEEHKELVIGMLDNLILMYKKFRVIPNASRMYLTGRSQPPLLTSFIMDVYRAYDMDKDWLSQKMTVALSEYERVWMGKTKPHHRQVYQGLSRYYDINVLHDMAEAESGWDMTPRFGRKCLDYLPIDLNSLLYKYEMDFAEYYKLLKKPEKAAHWKAAASRRKHTVNRLMWSELKGLYFDYNYVRKRRGTVSSLASMYPLWAGLATKKQARQLVKSLRRFDLRGGLAATDVQQLNIKMPGAMPTQWAHPNGWAPLHFIVTQGLERYGYQAEAKLIAMKWLHTNLDWFNKHHVFLERYNVVNPTKPPAPGVYPSPTGFGWTNAVFEYYCQRYVDN